MTQDTSLSSTSIVKLSDIAAPILPTLDALTTYLDLPRDVLASSDQIHEALSRIPKILEKIPPERRDERMVRMCIAVATGLFDSAVNYAWNAAVISLRDKIRNFGLNVVPQITGKDFDEQKLIDLRDSELLELCLKLNLLSEDGYFMLDQCRDIRNNFSSAHPSMGFLDENEFINFLSRCARHAVANEYNPKGLDVQDFIKALKAGKFSDTQLEQWRVRIAETFDAQREMLFGMLHGIYCDAAVGEEARLNSEAVCIKFSDKFTPKVRSGFIDRHQEYLAKGDEAKHKASLIFIERLKLIGFISTSERHWLISSACKRLMSVHNDLNNFYNEPPFAERLSGLAEQNTIPESVRYEYVETVITCAVGNAYGISNAANVYYEKMIQSFSPAEIAVLLNLPEGSSSVANRVRSYARCKTRYLHVVGLLSEQSIPITSRGIYNKILQKK